jgi:ferredoxin-NADP reductase
LSSTTMILTLVVLLSLYVIYGVLDGLQRRWQQYQQRQRLTLVVSRVRRQQDMVKIWLRHPQGDALPAARAGQHILLFGNDQQGKAVSRAYSLVHDCQHRHYYVLAIKAQSQGRLSQALFQTVTAGDKLQCSRPKGHFLLRQDWRHVLTRCIPVRYRPRYFKARPLVLVGAGIGITPMLAMAVQALRQERPVMLFYQARTVADLLWHRHLQRLPGLDYRPILSQPNIDWPGARGRITAALLIAQAGIDAHYYLCAQAQMVMDLEHDLRQAGVRHCYHELFSAAHSTQSFPLQLGAQQADSLGHRSVLDALLAANAQIPYDCRGGSCGQCRLKLISGHCQQVLAAEFEHAEDEILACCVQATSPLQLGFCQSESIEVMENLEQNNHQLA